MDATRVFVKADKDIIKAIVLLCEGHVGSKVQAIDLDPHKMQGGES